MLSVAVVGTFCSGKTTLVNQLTTTIPSAKPVSDECRPLLEEFGRVEWADTDLRSYLIVRQLLVESQTLRAADVIVVDGGIVNNLAHDRALLTSAPSRHGLINRLGHRRYDVVFWCDPADVVLSDDGQRFADEALRTELHGHVGAVLADLRYEPIRLSGGMAHRLQCAKTEVSRFNAE